MRILVVEDEEKVADFIRRGLEQSGYRSPTLHWYGNVGTGLSRDGRRLRVTGGTPCTADAIVPIAVHLYRYVPPPMTLGEGETWRSVIVCYMEAA